MQATYAVQPGSHAGAAGSPCLSCCAAHTVDKCPTGASWAVTGRLVLLTSGMHLGSAGSRYAWHPGDLHTRRAVLVLQAQMLLKCIDGLCLHLLSQRGCCELCMPQRVPTAGSRHSSASGQSSKLTSADAA